MPVDVGDSEVSWALRARATSRSVSGLFSNWCNVNLFKADTGGQLRIVTTSSFRSSVLT